MKKLLMCTALFICSNVALASSNYTFSLETNVYAPKAADLSISIDKVKLNKVTLSVLNKNGYYQYNATVSKSALNTAIKKSKSGILTTVLSSPISPQPLVLKTCPNPGEFVNSIQYLYVKVPSLPLESFCSGG